MRPRSSRTTCQPSASTVDSSCRTRPGGDVRDGVAVILIIGLALTFIGPEWARWGGLAATVLALAGASIGLYLALRGLGPNTVPDIVYHVARVALLLAGIGVAWRVPSGPSPVEGR